MVELNEDCLHEIIKLLTPLEWIHIFDVCQVWRRAVLRQWGKITELDYLDGGYGIFEKRDTEKVISGKDFEKIIIGVAPFIKTLRATSKSLQRRDLYVKFGNFQYKVDFFNVDSTLKLLAQNATEITEVEFDMAPKIELLKLLFKNNTIKKVKFFECNEFYEHVSTDDVEELDINIHETDFPIKSYKGHFPNLKKLSIDSDFEYFCIPRTTLSKILPYVLELRSFSLKLYFYPSRKESYKILWDITKFSKLEELNLSFDGIVIESSDILLKKIVVFCSELRNIRLDGIRVNETTLKALLTLPNLKSLNIDSLQVYYNQ